MMRIIRNFIFTFVIDKGQIMMLWIFITHCNAPFTAQAQTIIDFRFTAETVGWEEDFVGDIKEENLTITFITQMWIENIEKLPAIFTLDGNYLIKVDETVQVSGVTENDFRRDVVFKINDDVEYTVIFVSPQASGIPVIKIETVNGAPIHSKEFYTDMESFVLIDPNNPEYNIFRTNLPRYDRISGRGNSTWAWFNKKPYRVSFREDISFFGLPAR